MYKQQIIGIILATTFLIVTAFAHPISNTPPQTLRIALLDTPYNEMPLIPLLSDYEKAYFAGIRAAAVVASHNHIKIIYKPFFYASGPLDVFNKLIPIQNWQADAILGPSSSDQFSMLKTRLKHILILSSYASGKALQTLPKNFYSIFLDDNQIMTLLAKYIQQRFPNKRIFIIAQVDSKQCVDAGETFTNIYHRLSPHIRIQQRNIILDPIDAVDTKQLMARHLNDVTLIFTFTNQDYNTLIQHIADTFPQKNLIFFSDQDNWNDAGTPNNYRKNDLSYQSYRIAPILYDTTSLQFRRFKAAYEMLYHTPPKYAISYIRYLTVMAIVKALHDYPTPSRYQSMREKVLASFISARQHHPHWFKINEYGIFRLTTHGEYLVTKLPLPTTHVT